jgi:hypothetical protein
MQKLNFLQAPQCIAPGKYEWDLLEVKTSLQINAGNGVFAKQSLPIGTMFPIVGKAFPNNKESSHGWTYYSRTPERSIDGHPTIHPHKGVGSFGLAIAMMVNESASSAPNCIFWENYLVVAQAIGKGEELYVDYGEAHASYRQAAGYHIATYPTGWNQDVYKLKIPSSKEQNGLIDRLNQIIAVGIQGHAATPRKNRHDKRERKDTPETKQSATQVPPAENQPTNKPVPTQLTTKDKVVTKYSPRRLR